MLAFIIAIQIDTLKPIKVMPIPFILPKMVVSDSAKVKVKPVSAILTKKEHGKNN
jgi:hypothetical protein